MSAPRVLLFDSGMGGLTGARAVRTQLPGPQLGYSPDHAGFPYGPWEVDDLVKRTVPFVGGDPVGETVALGTLGQARTRHRTARERRCSRSSSCRESAR